MRSHNYLASLGMILSVMQSSFASAQGVPGARPLDAPVQATSNNRIEDEKVIRAASQAFATAIEKGDREAISSLLTVNAEYVDDDRAPVRGRDAVVAAYQKFLEEHKFLKAQSRINSIRFVGEETAIEEGQFEISSNLGPAKVFRYSILHVRQDKRWLIGMLKEWSNTAKKGARVADLEWLIGSWEAHSPHGGAHIDFEWAPNKSFIKGRYTIANPQSDEVKSSGTIVLGIDPVVGYIKEWLFSDEGDISESSWIWSEGRWMINTDGTLADGSSTTALTFLQPEGEDSFLWKGVLNTISGEDRATNHEVKVTRVKSKEAASK